MSLNIAIELYLICKAVLLGVFLRFVYDLFRISRRVFKRNAVVVGFEDAVYWMAAGICLFLLMYGFNGGSMRFHAFLFVALGMLLYGVSISPIMVKYISLLLLKIKFVALKLLKSLFKKVKIKKKIKDAKKDDQKVKSKKKKIK